MESVVGTPTDSLLLMAPESTKAKHAFSEHVDDNREMHVLTDSIPIMSIYLKSELNNFFRRDGKLAFSTWRGTGRTNWKSPSQPA